MLLDIVVADGEAQTRSLSHRLGRKKGLEYPADNSRRNATAVVRDVNDDGVVLAASLTVSCFMVVCSTARTPLKFAGDGLRDEESQRWNRVRHMPLRSSGGREGGNLRVAKVLLAERSFF